MQYISVQYTIQCITMYYSTLQYRYYYAVQNNTEQFINLLL